MLWPSLPVLKVLFVISLAYLILAWGKTLRKDSDLKGTAVLEADTQQKWWLIFATPSIMAEHCNLFLHCNHLIAIYAQCSDLKLLVQLL